MTKLKTLTLDIERRDVNARKIKKLADKIIESGVPLNYFTSTKVVDADRVTRSLLNGITSLSESERDTLDLVISVRDDQNLTRMRQAVKEEIEPLRNDIQQLKKVVGCNGNS